MVNYRRNFVPGGTFFFTVTLQNRKSGLLIDRINLFQDAFQSVKRQHPFQIKAYVVLPEHLHMIWELPKGDANYSLRWKKIKTLFSKSVHQSGFELSKTKHHEYRLWQRRFWEHTIKDMLDFENHLHYIHYNPIKHGLVDDLHDWPHSSFHHYVRSGRIDKHWASSRLNNIDDFYFGK
ncbi:REP-associated tyrosine transposase [Legionella bozemanae]|uniref:REP-associated tyrosine transposase n=1 Tax=Legionella bozemanae TaxID=447 RepID=UPI00399C7F34